MTAQWITRLGPYREARTRLAGPTHAWRHETGFETVPHPHRVLPESRLSLVTETLKDRSGEILSQHHWVYGPITTPRIYAPTPGQVLEGIYIPPEQALSVLGVRPDDLQNAVLPQSEFPNLRQSPPSQLTASAELAIWAANLLRATQGRVRIDRLADRAGVSPRHLHRSVTERLGQSPKALSSQLRLMAAVQTADQTPTPNWADIAFAHGYSDQAHLSRSVKAQTGLSPSALHTERSVESEIFKTPIIA